MPSQRSSAVAMLVIIAAILLASPSTAVSRAVNISSTWFLPQEGFPVFYRYFHDRITWFEADAVCQFHHANLVTVDTSVQYDATRAYLKELDIITNVWIGLKKSGADEEFAWTDYKTLSHDGGYWQEQISKSESPLCAVTDPAADFRWHSLNCGGPEVASFICELPVPPWAREDNGCMLTSLPSLTVIFLPEQGAVELTSDCGLEGTRRIACKGEANREEMMHQLSCDHGDASQEDDTSLSPEVTSSSSSSSATSFSSSSATSSSATSSSSSATSSGSASGGTTSYTSSGGSTSSGYTSGTRPYTGHSDEPPTRHRRDADNVASSQMISLVKSTTAVVQDTTIHVTTSAMNVDKGTVTSTMTPLDMSTSTTVAGSTTDASTAGLVTQEAENVTADNHTTHQEPQMTTSEMSPYTTTQEQVANAPEEVPASENEDSTIKGLDLVKVVTTKDLTTKDRVTVSTLAPTTAKSLLMNSLRAFKTERHMENAASSLPTTGELVTEPVITRDLNKANETVDLNNLANTIQKVQMQTAEAELTTTSQQLNATEASEVTSTTTDDQDLANLNDEEKIQQIDENNSREEEEEERLKEEERKEKENKFKEEEDNRRRLFLPSQLRNPPVVATEKPKLSEHPSVEDAYEEPAEMVEPEPEVPLRPNRGRQLTRPQTHSFYPYFLNRVLG